MATRKRASSSSGFAAEKNSQTPEEQVLEITEPASIEDLQEEVESVEKFLEDAVQEILAEEPPEVVPPPTPQPEKKHINPAPNAPTITRPRRNIPRFVR